MAWERYLEIIIVVNNRRGSPVATSLSNRQRLDAISTVSHDKFPVRLRFVEEPAASTGAFTQVQLPAGFAIVMAGKAASDLSSEGLLFLADDFTEHADGEDGWYYETVLDTNTTELSTAIAALSGSARVLPAVVDVEVQAGDNSERITFQFRCNIARQVYSGTEGVPTDAVPPYPSAPELLTRTASFRIGETGDPEFYNAELDQWVRLTVAGDPPQQTLTVLEAE